MDMLRFDRLSAGSRWLWLSPAIPAVLNAVLDRKINEWKFKYHIQGVKCVIHDVDSWAIFYSTTYSFVPEPVREKVVYPAQNAALQIAVSLRAINEHYDLSK
jgi:hypothetical protein